MTRPDKPVTLRRPSLAQASAPLLRRASRSGVRTANDFHHHLHDLREHHTSLQQDRSGALTPESGQALVALDEAWEELNRAEEELQRQSDELNEARAQLLVEQQRHRRLLDFTLEPCLITDRRGKIRHANRAAEVLLGSTDGTLAGRLALFLFCLRDRGLIRAHLAQSTSSPTPQSWECTLGSAPLRVVAVTLAPDGDDRLLWALRDLTEQRRHQARSPLERERQLRRQLETEGREREELLALVSHELRAPLQSVLGWSQFMQDSLDLEGCQQALGVVEGNARRMAVLVDDLLARASMLRSPRPLARERLDLHAVLTRVMASLDPLQRQNGVRFSLECLGPGRSALGDGPRLEQVFTNLLVNALAFTPAGGQIGVRLAFDSSHAEIGVSDSGQGIAAEHLPHLFDHSFQGANPAGSSSRGLGLGLAVVKHLVEAHGGSVWASSPGEGLGSTFVVRLPLAPAG